MPLDMFDDEPNEGYSQLYRKQEFKVDERVRIHSVGGDILSDKYGTILGKSFENVVDHYIVLLDEPLPKAKAICITEACLRRI